MRRLVFAAVAALALAVGLAPAAQAKTFCQKAAAGKKVVKRTGGVTVFRQGSLVSACSDAKRRSTTMFVLDDGDKVAKVAVASKRCLAIVTTGAKTQMVFKDLADRVSGSTSSTVGSVASLSVSTNCAVAWGESTSDGTTTSYRVQVRPINSLSSLPEGTVTKVADVAAAGDIAKVKATAAGKQVRVSWTLAGAAQSALLG